MIKRKRIAHTDNLSQSDLSSLLGYKNGQFISNVERSLCNIPFKMIKKVCQVLDIAPEEMKTAMMKDHEDTLDAYLRIDMTNPSGPFPDKDGIASQESAL